MLLVCIVFISQIDINAASKRNLTDISELTAHRENYFLAGDNYSDQLTNQIKFQISYKYKIISNIFGAQFYGSYTQRSFLEPVAYRYDGIVIPDSLYQPEFFFKFTPSIPYLSYIYFGLRHMSNGRGRDGEVYWGDRAFLEAEFELSKSTHLNIQTWKRNHQTNTTLDMDDYLGLAQIRLHHDFGDIGFIKDFSLATTARLGLKDSLSTPYQVAAYFQLFSQNSKIPYIYIQYWNGVGEFFTDYKKHTSRVRLGYSLSI